jgi:hypothetical protein
MAVPLSRLLIVRFWDGSVRGMEKMPVILINLNGLDDCLAAGGRNVGFTPVKREQRHGQGLLAAYADTQLVSYPSASSASNPAFRPDHSFAELAPQMAGIRHFEVRPPVFPSHLPGTLRYEILPFGARCTHFCRWCSPKPTIRRQVSR